MVETTSSAANPAFDGTGAAAEAVLKALDGTNGQILWQLIGSGGSVKALKAAIVCACSDDRWNDDVHYIGGAMIFDNVSWPSSMFGWVAAAPDPAVVGDLARLHLAQGQDPLPRTAPGRSFRCGSANPRNRANRPARTRSANRWPRTAHGPRASSSRRSISGRAVVSATGPRARPIKALAGPCSTPRCWRRAHGANAAMTICPAIRRTSTRSRSIRQRPVA